MRVGPVVSGDFVVSCVSLASRRNKHGGMGKWVVWERISKSYAMLD